MACAMVALPVLVLVVFGFGDEGWQRRGVLDVLALVLLVGLIWFWRHVHRRMAQSDPAEAVWQGIQCARRGRHEKALWLLRTAAEASPEAGRALKVLEDDLVAETEVPLDKIREAWSEVRGVGLRGRPATGRLTTWLVVVTVVLVVLRIAVAFLRRNWMH